MVNPGTNDNVIIDNIVFGNSNGILLVAGVEGNVVFGNHAVGNPPLQVPVNNPGTTGVDLRILATPGANVVEGNVCLTATNAVCSVTNDPRVQR